MILFLRNTGFSGHLTNAHRLDDTSENIEYQITCSLLARAWRNLITVYGEPAIVR